MPKISVIVPVYNVEPYLNRCIDSILGQSFSDLELILIDDGSPDNCGAICDAYQLQDSRVQVIHQKNGGLSAARNAGIDWAFANSDSEWLTFIDSDDWIHREYLMQLLTSAEKHGVDISVCDSYWADSFVEDAPLDDTPELLMAVDDLFVEHYEMSICACCVLMKKHLYSEVRFPVGKLYEDAFVTHKVLFACDKGVVVDQKLYYYYNNPTSITRIKWSDRKLDSIEAHELRLQYFQERGLQKAYLWEQHIYIQELTFKAIHLVETRESRKDHREALEFLRSRLRIALKRARKDKAVKMDRELLWAYMYAMHTDFVWESAMAARKAYHNLKK